MVRGPGGRTRSVDTLDEELHVRVSSVWKHLVKSVQKRASNPSSATHSKVAWRPLGGSLSIDQTEVPSVNQTKEANSFPIFKLAS